MIFAVLVFLAVVLFSISAYADDYSVAVPICGISGIIVSVVFLLCLLQAALSPGDIAAFESTKEYYEQSRAAGVHQNEFAMTARDIYEANKDLARYKAWNNTWYFGALWPDRVDDIEPISFRPIPDPEQQ